LLTPFALSIATTPAMKIAEHFIISVDVFSDHHIPSISFNYNNKIIGHKLIQQQYCCAMVLPDVLADRAALLELIIRG